MSYYRNLSIINKKSDGSPVTIADRESNNFIIDKLSILNYPIISEEGSFFENTNNIYWLVDPLDGTKDYINCNDEFTINIALILGNRPVLGIIYAPALEELYVGIKNIGTWKVLKGKKILTTNISKNLNIKMAISRFHNTEDSNNFALFNDIIDKVEIGASLKYGRIAFGEIDVYPRLTGTSEWDTAAGQIIVEAAGGSFLDWHTGLPMEYGKNNWRNKRFIVFSKDYKYNDFIYQNFSDEQL
jgi:3'(2'), 5'-bisphosphate nucleotidase